MRSIPKEIPINNYLDFFQDLLLAQKWANHHRLPFPRIDPNIFENEGLKECYVFDDTLRDERTPIVIHFVLANMDFRKYSKPGMHPLSSLSLREYRDYPFLI